MLAWPRFIVGVNSIGIFERVAELADAQALGACPERGGGSTPLSLTLKPRRCGALRLANLHILFYSRGFLSTGYKLGDL